MQAHDVRSIGDARSNADLLDYLVRTGIVSEQRLAEVVGQELAAGKKRVDEARARGDAAVAASPINALREIVSVPAEVQAEFDLVFERWLEDGRGANRLAIECGGSGDTIDLARRLQSVFGRGRERAPSQSP